MRRIALLLLAALVLTSCGSARSHTPAPAAAAPPIARVAPYSAVATTPSAGGSERYLRAASDGLARARAWWDPRKQWYRQQLGGSLLATNWGIVHLFDATSAVAIADPTPANQAAARAFADGAERYWNPDLRPVPGYGPYPGNRGANHLSWYDDEGWWGVAFYDAFRATGDRRYLASADRSLRFLDSGWDPRTGGIYWSTHRTFKASESLAGGTLLAAYLYRETHRAEYLALARKYIAWADLRLRGKDGLYASRPRAGVPMPYVEGPMAVAFAVLCRSGAGRSYCARAESLANRTALHFPTLTMGPQYDSIYVRALVELYRLDGKRRWLEIARAATDRAMAGAAGPDGLYLKTWDGQPIQSIGTPPRKLQTHGATTSAIAWVAVGERK